MFIITLIISAQAPQGFNYQAAVRNNTGALIINKNVTFKFNIIPSITTGTPVYTESQTVTTDDLGTVNLFIGKGTPITGTFATIDWGTGTYFLGIELNTGDGFKAMGTSQLLSVPYAMHAKTAESLTNLTFDFDFPDGFNFNLPVFLSNITNYTVPTGKNLYITNWRSNPNFNFTVNSAPFVPGIGSTTSAPKCQFVLGERMALVSAYPINIIGFLVNNTVQYVSFDLSVGNYTVPNNKLFIPCYFSSGEAKVNNIDFFLSGAVDENSIISGTTGVFLGYLKDK